MHFHVILLVLFEHPTSRVSTRRTSFVALSCVAQNAWVYSLDRSPCLRHQRRDAPRGAGLISVSRLRKDRYHLLHPPEELTTSSALYLLRTSHTLTPSCLVHDRKNVASIAATRVCTLTFMGFGRPLVRAQRQLCRAADQRGREHVTTSWAVNMVRPVDCDPLPVWFPGGLVAMGTNKTNLWILYKL